MYLIITIPEPPGFPAYVPTKQLEEVPEPPPPPPEFVVPDSAFGPLPPSLSPPSAPSPPPPDPPDAPATPGLLYPAVPPPPPEKKPFGVG